MCAGDLTLENANVVDGVRTSTFDGWGTTHKCRDWDTMYDFTYKHMAPNQF
jgi:aminoglycoside phosphotransferase family enzyme